MDNVESVSVERKSLSEKIYSYNDVRSKGIIIFGVALIAIIISLFGNIVSFSEARANINVDFAGWKLLGMFFTGNNVVKASIQLDFLLEFDVIVPQFVTIGYGIFFLALVIFSGIYCYFTLIKKQNKDCWICITMISCLRRHMMTLRNRGQNVRQKKHGQSVHRRSLAV